MWLQWIINAIRRLFGWRPTDPVEPPLDPPQEPVDPVEPAPEPFAHALWPDEWAVSGAWAIHDGYVQALEVGDGDIVDSTTVVLPTGVLTVTARIWAPEPSSDAFYVVLDGFATRLYPTEWGTWTTVDLPLGVTEAGPHRVGISTGEPGLIIDALAITSSDWTGSLEELLGSPPALPVVEPPVVVIPDPPEEPDPVEPAEPPFHDTSLRVNALFDPRDPRDKDGRALTAEMREIYDAIIDYWVGGEGKSTTVERFKRGDSYNLGRGASKEVVALKVLLRAVGDVRLVDCLAELLTHAESGLRTTWSSGAQISRAPHGKAFFPWLNSRDYADIYGQDFHLSDTPRAWAVIAGIAWALSVNRDVTSPRGFDYGGLADLWTERLSDLEEVWSGPTDQFPDDAKVASTYKGYRKHPGGGMTRKARGDWPIWMRGGSHTNWGIARLTYYMGRLLGKPEAQSMSAITEHVTEFMRHEQGTVATTYGDGLLFGRQNHRWYADETDYEIPTTYAEMIVADALDLHLEGATEGLVEAEFFQRFARSVAGRVLAGPANDFIAKAGLAGIDDPPFITPSGVTRRIGTACDSPSSTCADRTAAHYALYSYHLLMAWDTPDDRLENCGRESWVNYRGASDKGGLTEPRSLLFPVGLFLKRSIS